MVGLKAMSPDNVKQVFKVLDVDASGFIEEEELKWETPETKNTPTSPVLHANTH